MILGRWDHVPAFHLLCLQGPCESSAFFVLTSGRTSQVLRSLAAREPQVDPEIPEQAQKYPATYLSHPCVGLVAAWHFVPVGRCLACPSAAATENLSDTTDVFWSLYVMRDREAQAEVRHRR